MLDHRVRELDSEQRREYIDLTETFQAWREASEHLAHYAGGMHWKTVGGHAYLIRTLNSRGRQESLGPRSEENERRYTAFHEGKERAKARVHSLREALQHRARVARAQGLGRVPEPVARVMRAFDHHPQLKARMRVIGTHALYAYEAMAGVHLEPGMVATRDVDWMWDNRLTLSVPDLSNEGVLGLLQKKDQSFARAEHRRFAAINKDGLMVELLSPMASPPHKTVQRSVGTEDDLETADLEGLSWLVSSPRVEAIAVDLKGYPVEIPTIDPRAFALHKLWVADRPDRDPYKRKRDVEQAGVVGRIVSRYLPGYPMDPGAAELSGIPGRLRERLTELHGAQEDDPDPDFPFEPTP